MIPKAPTHKHIPIRQVIKEQLNTSPLIGGLTKDIFTNSENIGKVDASVQSLSRTTAEKFYSTAENIEKVFASTRENASETELNAQAVASLDSVKAMWTAKVQAGDIAAGIGIVASQDSNGNTISQVAVAANQFFIFDPNNPNDKATYAIPFAVVDGKVVID
ncbi:phage tail tip fiber protein [Pectobacterium jejuense]|uniref:DUF1983 domain-containing protein n=1 Tax=Pectobacterium jejuense TaxID=2974022 RepID=A0ABW8GS39_9GAMM